MTVSNPSLTLTVTFLVPRQAARYEVPVEEGNSRSRIAALAFPVVVAWLAGFVFAYGATDFSLDDAWIHLSYARSLKLGEGLSYNPYDWETGFSSTLWVLALWILPWFGDPVIAAKALGVLLHSMAAGLAALCATTSTISISTIASTKAGSPTRSQSWRTFCTPTTSRSVSREPESLS